MSKTCFLLISVIGDEMLTEQFRDLHTAQLCLRSEIRRYCLPEFMQDINKVLSHHKSWTDGGYALPSGNMGLGLYEAYMNDMVGKEPCSWRIVEIIMD